MHIPDGFLSTPVWATLDVAAAPAVGFAVRQAQKSFDEAKAPLLGVMGAFVFAAQLINFPVGLGTSGHLIGGALLAYALGPASASVVMTAILGIQALVFQDGGVLALGANVLNMALCGVLAGYLPFAIWGAGPRRKAAIFAGGLLSVFVSAALALGELMISGVRIPAAMLNLSLALFAVSGILEGAITVAVVQALESINPEFIRRPDANRRLALGAVAAAALVLAGAGFLFASTHPDGLEKLVQQLGIDGRARAFLSTPLADYEAGFFHSPALRKAAAGIAGLGLIYAACRLFGRYATRRAARTCRAAAAVASRSER